MGQLFTSNTSLNSLFVDLVWSISRDRPCHHNPICKGNLFPRLWNNKNGIESTVSNKMTAKLVVKGIKVKKESYECLNSYELLNKYFILRFLLAVLMWEFLTMLRDASCITKLGCRSTGVGQSAVI